MLNTLKAPQPLSFIPGNDDGGTSGCHDRIDLTPSNMVLNVLGPCLPGSAVSLSTLSSLAGIVQWRKSFLIRPGKNGLLSLYRQCQDPSHGRSVATQTPWPFSWTTTTNRESAQSDIGTLRTHIRAHALGHTSLFPSSLACLPIPLFLATYTAAIAQRSTDRHHFKRPDSRRVLGANFGLASTVVNFLCKHAAQLY
jgi:hypothetical protein